MILDWVSGIGLLIIGLIGAYLNFRNTKIAQAKNNSELKKTESDLESSQIADAKSLGNFAMTMFRQTQTMAEKWEAKAQELQEKYDALAAQQADAERRHSEQLALLQSQLTIAEEAFKRQGKELEMALADNSRLTTENNGLLETNARLMRQLLARQRGTKVRTKKETDQP